MDSFPSANVYADKLFQGKKEDSIMDRVQT